MTRFLDSKPFVYLWRPVYRLVFGGLVWPFLERVKVVFVAGIEQRLGRIDERLAAIEAALGAERAERTAQALADRQLLAGVADRLAGEMAELRRSMEQHGAAADRLGAEDAHRAAALRGQLDSLAARLAELDSASASQWAAIEQLVLSILSTAGESRAAGK